MRHAWFLLLWTVGCTDTTPAWDLTRDRIIAVRATPPAILAGETTTLDALVAVGRTVSELAPADVTVSPGGSLSPTVTLTPSGWTVTAPAELPATPVAVTLAFTIDVGGELRQATKAVWFGVARANPSVELAIDGMTSDAEIAVDREVELVASADESNPDEEIDWLTTIGELTDVDDPIGHLTCEEPGEGTVVVVRRDGAGGVAWKTGRVVAR